MELALVLLSLWAWSARAEGPAIPLGLPPAEKLVEIPKGFTLNAEVLERYQYTLDQYNALNSSEQQRVSDWIEVLEHDRLYAEAKAKAAAAQPRKLKLTPETEAAMARLKAGLSANFDGAAKPDASGSTWVPSLTMRGPGVANGDATDYTGTFRKLTFSDPKSDTTFTYGVLGADGLSPMVEASPYVGVEKGWNGSNGTVDYSARASLNALNLGARLYTNDDGPADAQINQGLSTLGSAAAGFGINPSGLNSVANSLSYSTSFEQQWLLLGSMMGRVGRAYHLLGDENHGVDWGWSAMGTMRVNEIFPNANLDQTAGVRVRTDPEHNIGLFAGVTEGIGLFSKSVVADSISAGQIQTDIQPQAAPHATISSWGKMPYLSGTQYEVSAGMQWNPWTTVRMAAASVIADAGHGVKIGAFGTYSDESGAAIEYDREKSAGGLRVEPAPGVGISAQYFNQNAAYGDARVQSQGVMLGLTLKDSTPGGDPRGSVTMESLFGGQEHLIPSQASAQMTQQIQSILNELQALKAAGLAYTGGTGGAWADVQAGWAHLSPAAQQALTNAFAVAAPSAPPLSQIISGPPALANEINNLINVLSDTQVIERVIVRYLRHEVLAALSNAEIPVLGQNFKMTIPMLLAAANAYSMSLTPLPPITANDANTSLNGFLFGQLTNSLGCGKGASAQDTTTCILSKLPPAEAAILQAAYGRDANAILQAAVSWVSSVIRTEMNQTVLQMLLAAETLNELAVDKGERIGDLNVRGMMSSFEYLDARTRAENHRMFAAAKKDLSEEIAAQDAAMRDQLTDYGASRLSWLEHQAAWPAGVRIAIKTEDWAPLLAVYGDKAIFDLILKCKAKLAAKGGNQGLLISLDRVSPLNSIVVSAGNPAELRLPPKPVNLSSFDLSL